MTGKINIPVFYALFGLFNFHIFFLKFLKLPRFVVSSPWMAGAYCLGIQKSPKSRGSIWVVSINY